MANYKNKNNKKKLRSNKNIFLIILVIYLLITLGCTMLYEILPLPRLCGIFAKDSFYEAIVTGMYNSAIDFLVFSIVLSFFLNRWEKKNTIKKYLDDIDACRFWIEDQAAYRIRSIILKLQEERILSIDLTKCYLENIILKKLSLHDSQMMGCMLNKSNLESSEFINCNLQGAFCENSIFRIGTFKDCNLKHLKCQSANFKSINAENCDFKYSDFENADLRSSILKNCNLEKVNYSGCNLERANLLSCYNIAPADIIKCKTLKYAKLSQDIVDYVKKNNPSLLL